MGGGEVFHFGEFMLEVAERRLTHGGEVVRLSPKAHDVLVAAPRPGRASRHEGRAPVPGVARRVCRGRHSDRPRLGIAQGVRRRQTPERLHRDGVAIRVSVRRTGHPRTGRPRHGAAACPATACGTLRARGRGRARVLSGSCFELPDAVSSFRAAIEIDSTYAAAHAGLALACCLQGCLGSCRTRRRLPRRSRPRCARWPWTASARMHRWRSAPCCS